MSIFAIANREIIYNLKSLRMFIMIILFALAVVGGAYGFSILSFHPELMPENIRNLLAERNPDILLYLSGIFIAFVGSVFAILLSFDSIVKERLQHSIELLVCRPVTKNNIVIGKFLGILVAVATPVTAVIICAILAIWCAIGALPTFKMAAGLVILTIVLLAIFIAIQFVFSSLAKSLGTAIIFGIGVWFLFTSFWTIVPLSAAYISGIPLQSPEYNILRSRIDLLSPIGSYDLALGVLAKNTLVTPELHCSLPFISLVLWLLLSLWCSAEIFRRIGY